MKYLNKDLLKQKKKTIWTMVAITGGIVVVAYCSHFFLGEDNRIEEWGEKYLEEKTSIDIDFTPSSPERKSTIWEL